MVAGTAEARSIWLVSCPPERTPAHLYLHEANAWSSPASEIELPKAIRWLPNDLADSISHPSVALPAKADGFAVSGFAAPPWDEQRERGVTAVQLLPLSSNGKHAESWASFSAGSTAGSVFCARDEEGDETRLVFAASPLLVLASMWVMPDISGCEHGLYSTFPGGYGAEVSLGGLKVSVFADRTENSEKLLRSVSAECSDFDVFYPKGNALRWDTETAASIRDTENFLLSEAVTSSDSLAVADTAESVV